MPTNPRTCFPATDCRSLRNSGNADLIDGNEGVLFAGLQIVLRGQK